MTDTNPFDAWMKASQDWAKNLSPEFAETMRGSMKSVVDLMPTMPAEMMEALMGKGANPDALDAKTKLLLTLQGLTIQGALADAQIALTVRHALAAGATPVEVTETIALAGLFGGAPAMTKALDIARGEISKAAKNEDDPT